MDSIAAFERLLSRMGLSEAQTNAFVEFGCDTLTDLATFTYEDIEKTISVIHKTYATGRTQVRFNVITKIKLKALAMHFKDRVRCYDALLNVQRIDGIDDETVDDFVADFREEEDSSQRENIDDLPSIEIGKLSRKNWRSFNTAFTETLSRTIGRNKLPLTYVIREIERNDFDAIYSNRRERLHECIRFSGQAYRRDREIVFSLLLQKTKDSEGFSIVEEFLATRNGRAAYTSLRGHFEDSTYRDRMSQEGTYTLRNTVYAGVRKNFTFGRYYQLHSEAHVQLSEAGLPMTAEQKINDFITGITCPIAQSIIVSLAGNRAIRGSFESYYNELSSRLSLALRLAKGKSQQSENRNVNSVDSNKKNKANKRYGQSGEKEDGSSNKRPKVSNNFTPEDKVYEKEAWKRLTHEQRKKVVELRRENRRKRFSANRNFSQAHGQYGFGSVGQGLMPPPPPPPPPPSVFGGSHIQQINANYVPNGYYGGYYGTGPNNFDRSIANMSNTPYPPNIVQNSDSTHVSALSAHSGQVGRAFGGGSNNYNGSR